MRTPNTSCHLCAKPLYRRPYEFERVRYFACMDCRAKAQSVVGVTEAQRSGLSLGRSKGTNHRTGYRHREESKRKVAETNRAYWAANPGKAKARGAAHCGEKAYNWKGGITDLNKSIRTMHENRKWMESVKKRDRGCCVRCGSTEHLEAHHKRTLESLLTACCIKTRDDARKHAVIIWDINDGETLCRPCHYAEHGRKPRANRRKRISANAIAPAGTL